MSPARPTKFGLLVAPAVAVAIGVWAEFAHLTPPILFVVSVPAIIVSAVSLTYFAKRIPMLLARVVAGAAVGVLTFGLAEGTHVAIALARGSDLDFGEYQSRVAIASGLVGVHLAAGAMIGAGVGLGLAVLYAGTAFVVRRTSVRSRTGSA